MRIGLEHVGVKIILIDLNYLDVKETIVDLIVCIYMISLSCEKYFFLPFTYENIFVSYESYLNDSIAKDNIVFSMKKLLQLFDKIFGLNDLQIPVYSVIDGYTMKLFASIEKVNEKIIDITVFDSSNAYISDVFVNLKRVMWYQTKHMIAFPTFSEIRLNIFTFLNPIFIVLSEKRNNVSFIDCISQFAQEIINEDNISICIKILLMLAIRIHMGNSDYLKPNKQIELLRNKSYISNLQPEMSIAKEILSEDFDGHSQDIDFFDLLRHFFIRTLFKITENSVNEKYCFDLHCFIDLYEVKISAYEMNSDTQFTNFFYFTLNIYILSENDQINLSDLYDLLVIYNHDYDLMNIMRFKDWVKNVKIAWLEKEFPKYDKLIIYNFHNTTNIPLAAMKTISEKISKCCNDVVSRDGLNHFDLINFLGFLNRNNINNSKTNDDLCLARQEAKLRLSAACRS